MDVGGLLEGLSIYPLYSCLYYFMRAAWLLVPRGALTAFCLAEVVFNNDNRKYERQKKQGTGKLGTSTICIGSELNLKRIL